jgi:hypothetical protein
MGVDMQVIGEIVGQSSVQVEQIYRHAQAADKRAAVDTLVGAFGAALDSARPAVAIAG